MLNWSDVGHAQAPLPASTLASALERQMMEALRTSVPAAAPGPQTQTQDDGRDQPPPEPLSARTPRPGTREASSQTPELPSAGREQQDRDATAAGGLGSQDGAPLSVPADAPLRSRPAAPLRPSRPVVESAGPSVERQPARALAFSELPEEMVENALDGYQGGDPPFPPKAEGWGRISLLFTTDICMVVMVVLVLVIDQNEIIGCSSSICSGGGHGNDNDAQVHHHNLLQNHRLWTITLTLSSGILELGLSFQDVEMMDADLQANLEAVEQDLQRRVVEAGEGPGALGGAAYMGEEELQGLLGFVNPVGQTAANLSEMFSGPSNPVPPTGPPGVPAPQLPARHRFVPSGTLEDMQGLLRFC
eukprot:jgi/Botrbrau1/1765/Bobra.0217s0020.1